MCMGYEHSETRRLRQCTVPLMHVLQSTSFKARTSCLSGTCHHPRTAPASWRPPRRPCPCRRPLWRQSQHPSPAQARHCNGHHLAVLLRSCYTVAQHRRGWSTCAVLCNAPFCECIPPAARVSPSSFPAERKESAPDSASSQHTRGSWCATLLVDC